MKLNTSTTNPESSTNFFHNLFFKGLKLAFYVKETVIKSATSTKQKKLEKEIGRLQNSGCDEQDNKMRGDLSFLLLG